MQAQSLRRALRAVNSAGKLKGIKGYYGDVPDKEDPNLRMTGIFSENPGISDEAALTELARTIGKTDRAHLLTATVLKGASWQTPAWQSNRRTAFMRTDQTDQPNFWMRENTQLCLVSHFT